MLYLCSGLSDFIPLVDFFSFFFPFIPFFPFFIFFQKDSKQVLCGLLAAKAKILYHNSCWFGDTSQTEKENDFEPQTEGEEQRTCYK